MSHSRPDRPSDARAPRFSDYKPAFIGLALVALLVLIMSAVGIVVAERAGLGLVLSLVMCGLSAALLVICLRLSRPGAPPTEPPPVPAIPRLRDFKPVFIGLAVIAFLVLISGAVGMVMEPRGLSLVFGALMFGLGLPLMVICLRLSRPGVW